MNGKIPIRDSRFLIVGLARNCSRFIEGNINILKKSFSSAKEISFLIIESDSIDNTKEQLKYLKEATNNFDFVSLGNLVPVFPKRTERIAYCRNYYLREISENSLYQNIDFVVVADLDDVNNGLTSEAVHSCWDTDIEWDVCCACQNGPYYDIWALRHTEWSPNDCLKQQSFLRELGESNFKSYYVSVLSRMINVSKNGKWIEVDSAFGGCAIYKRKYLLNVSYNGLTNDVEEVCEHVSLNEMIKKKNGRIFINPNFINATVVAHARNSHGFALISHWLMSQIKDILRFLNFNTQAK